MTTKDDEYAYYSDGEADNEPPARDVADVAAAEPHERDPLHEYITSTARLTRCTREEGAIKAPHIREKAQAEAQILAWAREQPIEDELFLSGPEGGLVRVALFGKANPVSPTEALSALSALTVDDLLVPELRDLPPLTAISKAICAALESVCEPTQQSLRVTPAKTLPKGRQTSCAPSHVLQAVAMHAEARGAAALISRNVAPLKRAIRTQGDETSAVRALRNQPGMSQTVVMEDGASRTLRLVTHTKRRPLTLASARKLVQNLAEDESRRGTFQSYERVQMVERERVERALANCVQKIVEAASRGTESIKQRIVVKDTPKTREERRAKSREKLAQRRHEECERMLPFLDTSLHDIFKSDWRKMAAGRQ